MATSVTLNGTSYNIPALTEDGYGQELTNYFIALSTGVLQKAGGAFTLTADIDFGASYGLKAQYVKDRGTASSAGSVRLSNDNSVGWRDNANSTDKLLKVNTSDQLEIDGNEIATHETVTKTEYGYVNGVTSAIQTQIDSKQADVITTRGDIVYGNASGVATRLPIGAENKVLGSDGTDIVWTSTTAGDTLSSATSTDNTIVRYDGTNSKTIQASSISIDDSDNITGCASITLDGGGTALSHYEEFSTSLGGDFSAGTVHGARIGKIVTLTVTGANWTNDTAVLSSSGDVPANFRPTKEVLNICGQEANRVIFGRVSTVGQVILDIRTSSDLNTSASSGTDGTDVDTRDFCISYVVY